MAMFQYFTILMIIYHTIQYAFLMIIVDCIGGEYQTKLSCSEYLSYKLRIVMRGENIFCGQAYYMYSKFNS